MDLQKILSSVNNLNDYIAATEIVSKFKNSEVQLTITNVLNLKKVRSLEIEYFQKCDGVGAALAIFERLLKQPPTNKTWGLLGKEMTGTILYWLEAVRRHLISHTQNWWMFLKTILRFIRDMKSKDPALPDIIVEQTIECLLDLSCNDRLDEIQRHEVLHTVNECSAKSSRKLRLQMREQLSDYFIRLSSILPSCGHVPTQTATLECLLRWLVGRGDPAARRAAAAAWLPYQLYRRAAVDLFLERTWADFYQDARQFLNLQNANRPDCVTSILCKKLEFGSVNLIKAVSVSPPAPQCRSTWLDINAGTRTITVTLDPSLVESPFADDKNLLEELLVLHQENVLSVQLHRSSSESKLSVHLVAPAQLGRAAASSLAATISARQLAAADEALRQVFRNKYSVLLDKDDVMSSPEKRQPEPTSRQVRSTDEIRRSNIPLRRRTQSGTIVRSRHPLQWNSPSTTSTTSLAQLPEKLAALPPLNYCSKRPAKISAQPELSIVSEVSEGEEFSCSQSITSRPKPLAGVASINNRNSTAKTNYIQKDAPPISQEKDEPVCPMLIATLGSTDEKFINETSKNLREQYGEIDLVELIIKEALQNKQETDSGITIDKKTQESEVIENTPAEKQIRNKKPTKKRSTKCTIVSNSTTDESNTEPVNEVNEAPCFVTDRKRRFKRKDIINATSEESKKLDTAAIDALFSQEDEKAAGCLISPTLARKLNETSSEVSECDHNIKDQEIITIDLTFEADIIDCLNNMVDEVCSNLDKYAEMLGREQREFDNSEIAQNIVQNQNVNDAMLNDQKTRDNVTSNDDARVVTLRYPRTKKRAPKKNTKQKTPTEDKKKVNTSHDDEDVVIENTNTNSPVNKPNTSLIRKKRRLYSPKDNENDMDEVPRAKVESRLSLETPMATCYKELELARKTRSRIPRKLITNSTEASPKTKKLNEMFDKLKEKLDNEENITLVKRKSNKKDSTVYNFTSDSEDEDFKKKKVDLRKRVSRTSTESTTKRGRTVKRINYSDGNHNSSSDETKRNTKKRKVVKQIKLRDCKIILENSIDLIDERMREAPTDVLETSFVKETTVEKVIPDPEPSIAQVPEIEIIPESEAISAMTVLEHKLQKKKKAEVLQLKRERVSNKKFKKNTEILTIKKENETNKKQIVEKNTTSEGSGSDSSLPGLVVESEQPRKDVMSSLSSLEANLLQEFKKICSEEHDLDELDATQSLLLRDDNFENSRVSNNDKIIHIYDDNCDDVSIGNDLNQNTLYPKETITETINILGSPLEKSIATGGKSPITGHNDLDESPPGIALLEEKFKGRDLEIQDMNQSMVDFYVQLKSALQSHGPSSDVTDKQETYQAVGLTRLSSKEQAMTPKSSISTPRLVLTKMPLNEIQKYVSPVKSKKSNSTIAMSSPSVVLERLSSDEINRWLPMPRASREDVKNNTKIPTKQLKRINTTTPKKKVSAQRIKTIISPIRLSFDVAENKCSSNSSAKENVDVANLQTNRLKTNSLKTKSQETNKDLEDNSELTPESARSIASVKEWFKKSMAASQASSGKAKFDHAAITDIVEKVLETVQTTLSEIDESTGNKYASMFMDTQMHLKDLANKFRETNEQINSQLISEIATLITEKNAERDRRFQEMTAEFEKCYKERACDVIREEKKQKMLMMELLKEDLQAILDLNSKNNETK